MSKGRSEGNRRYWERLMRNHAREGKDRTASVRPRGAAPSRRTERGGRRDG